MKGLFIVFEGIDGSGTSTQSELLKDYFLSQGHPAVVSPEPSTGPIGQLIRHFLKSGDLPYGSSQQFDQQLAYLFAADRYYHLHNQVDGVFKLLQQNIHVITTRYYFSSLAYNCHNQQDIQLVSSLNQNFPNPDILIYIDIPLEQALDRVNQRSYKEIYENHQKLLKVKNNYQDILNNYQGVVWRVDGSLAKEETHREIIAFLKSVRYAIGG